MHEQVQHRKKKKALNMNNDGSTRPYLRACFCSRFVLFLFAIIINVKTTCIRARARAWAEMAVAGCFMLFLLLLYVVVTTPAVVGMIGKTEKIVLCYARAPALPCPCPLWGINRRSIGGRRTCTTATTCRLRAVV